MAPSPLGRPGTSPAITSTSDGSGSGTSLIETLNDRPHHNIPSATQDMVKRGQNAQGLPSGGMVSCTILLHVPYSPETTWRIPLALVVTHVVK